MAQQGAAPALSTEARPPWLPDDIDPEGYHKAILDSLPAYTFSRIQDVEKHGVEKFIGVFRIQS